MNAVLFSPHSDDETLFAFYTILRDRPTVMICFGSERDYGSTQARFEESQHALKHTGVPLIEQLVSVGEEDLEARMRAYDAAHHPEVAWAPNERASHRHHHQVTACARRVFGDRLRTFHTYDEGGKVREGVRVEIEEGWDNLKRQALACYRTQITHPRARIFYDEARFELDEYVEPAKAVVGSETRIVAEGIGVVPDTAPPLSKRAQKKAAKPPKGKG